MSRIESLTQDQIKRFPEFAKKWIENGVNTKTNREAAERACREAYKEGGLEEPKLIIWANSPLGMLMTSKLVKEMISKGIPPYQETSKDNVWDNVGDNVWDNVGDNVWDNVRDNVWDNVWANVGANVRANVRDNVRDNVGDNVRANVRDNVRDNVGANVRDNVGDNENLSDLRSEYNEYIFDKFYDVDYLSFYDFFKEVCGLESCKRLEPLSKLAKEVSWCLFYKNVAILTENPIEIHRNSENRLHNNNGPCVKWSDGYELYCLNGIRLSKEIALLKPEEISKDTILKQENADYRREIVRKLSGKQLLDVLDPKVLDEKYGYTLLSIDLGDNRQRPFLKMDNPSIDAVHVEGVLPSCKTVEDAIRFRNGLSEFELPLTLDGFELFSEYVGLYHQQGDLLLFPDLIPSDAEKCAHNTAGDGLIRHTLVNGEIFEKNGIRFLGANKGAKIIHPEHKNVNLQEGLSYRVAKTLEYDHWKEESREVID